MPYNQHSNEYKINAINDYKETCNKAKTSKKFKIDRKTLSEWIKNESEIKSSDPKRFRLDGGGRKINSETLEDILLNKIEDERLQKKRVSRKNICMWAKEFAIELGLENFDASIGWLDKFLKRNHLTLRKANRICSLSDDEIIKRSSIFIKHVKNFIEEKKITADNIFNFDETAIFIENDSTLTIDKIGVNKVPVLSAGLTRFRITGICAASADGHKLMPTIITKGKKENISIVDGVVRLTGFKSWINSNLLKKWIEFMFPIVSTPKNKILLIFDSARSHISKDIKKYLKLRKIFFCVIPGGLTGLLQPADAYWFKTLKTNIRMHSTLWLESSNVERNKSGKIKIPSDSIIAKWLLDSWNEINHDLIVNSFLKCFIGYFDDLLIANDLQYGEKFIREMEKNSNNEENEIEEFEESDFSAIDE